MGPLSRFDRSLQLLVVPPIQHNFVLESEVDAGPQLLKVDLIQIDLFAAARFVTTVFPSRLG